MPIIFICTSLMRLIPLSLNFIPHQTNPRFTRALSTFSFSFNVLVLHSMAQRATRINIIQYRRHSINKFLLYTFTCIWCKVFQEQLLRNWIGFVLRCDAMQCDACNQFLIYAFYLYLYIRCKNVAIHRIAPVIIWNIKKNKKKKKKKKNQKNMGSFDCRVCILCVLKKYFAALSSLSAADLIK